MSLKNAKFVCEKVAATHLFKPMLIRATPAGVRQHLSWSVVGSERHNAWWFKISVTI